MKLSAAIATYNEETTIEKCLVSVWKWVDEIIIYDGSSSDETVKIAKKFNAHVYIVENQKIFHINKQKAIDASSGEWILQLDADEVVTDQLKTEIQKAIQTKTYNGYWLPRKNLFLGRFLEKGGQYPDYTLRLYKKGKGKLPCKSVHEQAQVQGTVGYLYYPLLHYSYPNFNHYIEHFNRYTDVFAQELIQQNISSGLTESINYLLVKPLFWFLSTYFRYKGFIDGFPGLVFSICSALRFPVSFIKMWERKKLQIDTRQHE